MFIFVDYPFWVTLKLPVSGDIETLKLPVSGGIEMLLSMSPETGNPYLGQKWSDFRDLKV